MDTVTLTTSVWDSNGYDVYLNGVLQRSGSTSQYDVYRDSTTLKFTYELVDGDFVFLRKFT